MNKEEIIKKEITSLVWKQVPNITWNWEKQCYEPYGASTWTPVEEIDANKLAVFLAKHSKIKTKDLVK